jgi:hypothetical protein
LEVITIKQRTIILLAIAYALILTVINVKSTQLTQQAPTPSPTVYETPTPSPVIEIIEPKIVLPEAKWYTEDDEECLAILIYRENGGDGSSDDTRRKTGSVALNRLKMRKWGDTIRQVAEAPGQYTGMSGNAQWPSRAKNSGEKHAVWRAYKIAHELLETGSILPADVIWQSAEDPEGKYVYKNGELVPMECVYYQDGTYYCR